MKDITAAWDLSPKAVTSALHSIWLVFTATTALVIYSTLSKDKDITIQLLSFALVFFLYFLVCYLIRRTYYLTNFFLRPIKICEGTLSIPRLILPDHLIEIYEIKSVEKYENSKEILGIFIGILQKSSIFVERRNFNSEDDFNNFATFLSEVAIKNRSKNLNWQPFIENCEKNKSQNFLSGIFSLAFATIYLICSSDGFLTISNNALLEGGLTKNAIGKADFYRFASSFFLHHDPYHLLFNILSISMVGQYIDVILGKHRFFIVFLTSAFAGALMSIAFSDFTLVIGASGGIFGLFGAYFTVCINHQNRIPGSVSLSFRTISLVLASQVLLDLIVPKVDFFSHIGGFLFGSIYTVYALRRIGLDQKMDISISEKIIAIVLPISFAIGIVYFLTIFSR